jgi:two-component system chemotaxis response regulator CheY
MSKTILIVDDSISMRQMVAFTTKDGGYNVLEGANGQEALQKLQGQRVDVVITDLNMPVMDGFALSRALRSNPLYKFTPILMLTTESQESKKMEGKAAGVTAWIVKPFKPAQLLAILDRFVH